MNKRMRLTEDHVPKYLHQTVLSLGTHGIHDSYLWDLQERVAALIEAQA
jgi:hypothetical protein